MRGEVDTLPMILRITDSLLSCKREIGGSVGYVHFWVGDGSCLVVLDGDGSFLAWLPWVKLVI